MYFKGKKLEEITEPQIFDPPQKMIVWDKETTTPFIKTVFAITARTYFPVVAENTNFNHCAKIPEEPKPCRATKRELVRWIAQGKGEWKNEHAEYAFSQCDSYYESEADEPCSEKIVVRKWDDSEWHEPTREYLGLEDK